MTQEEIIQNIVAYLDQHLQGGRGYVGQEPYLAWNHYEA